MKDKVLVEIVIPSLELSYNAYIPVSRKVGNIIALIAKSIYELTNGLFTYDENTMLYDQDTGLPYAVDSIVKDTTIRNGSKIILF